MGIFFLILFPVFYIIKIDIIYTLVSLQNPARQKQTFLVVFEGCNRADFFLQNNYQVLVC